MVSNGLFPQADQAKRWKRDEWSTYQSTNTPHELLLHENARTLRTKRHLLNDETSQSRWHWQTLKDKKVKQRILGERKDISSAWRNNVNKNRETWSRELVLSLHKTCFYYSQHQQKWVFFINTCGWSLLMALNPQLLQADPGFWSYVWMSLVGAEEFSVESFLAALILKPWISWGRCMQGVFSSTSEAAPSLMSGQKLADYLNFSVSVSSSAKQGW